MEPPASSRDVGRCTHWAGIVGKNSLVQQFSLASKLDIGGPVSLAHPCCPSWHEWASIYKSSGKSLSAHKWGPERRQRPGPKQGTKSRIIINNNNNKMPRKQNGKEPEFGVFFPPSFTPAFLPPPFSLSLFAPSLLMSLQTFSLAPLSSYCTNMGEAQMPCICPYNLAAYIPHGEIIQRH